VSSLAEALVELVGPVNESLESLLREGEETVEEQTES
jgi:hypothetical protein